jgi:hypothetical protein
MDMFIPVGQCGAVETHDKDRRPICLLHPSGSSNRIRAGQATKSYNGGKVHVSCYKIKRKEAAPSAPVSIPPSLPSLPPSLSLSSSSNKPSKRRRTQSDPGEQQTVAAFSPRQMRVRAPKPIQPDRKKQKQEKEDAVLAQLDATHQRRLAALVSAAASQPSRVRSVPKPFTAPASITLSFSDSPQASAAARLEAERLGWATRTPAQWRRRHYLMHIAPKCKQCGFPRTGRKGWNDKLGCHTDLDCNDHRWRVIDAFC